MGYQARFTGEITIAPPLTWAEIRSPSRRGLQDLQFRTREETTETETGQNKTVTGEAVKAATAEPFTGHDMQEELQSIVDAYGRSHQFTGHIEAVGEEGDRWRLLVRDGKAVQVYPQITWPEEVAPRFGELGADGHPPAGDYDLWQAAIWVPGSREAEVQDFLAAAGLTVYRMWKVQP